MTERPEFDMSGWVNLISEVQQLGLETARTVAARFGDLADANLGAAGSTAAPPVDAAVTAWRTMVDQATDPAMQQQVTAAAQKMTDAIVGMMRAAWDVMSESAADVSTLGWPSQAADLGSAAGGAIAEGKVHVHVGSNNVPGEVKLRVSDLAAGSGDTIPGAAVRIDPGAIQAPQSGHHYPVTLKVAVPDDATVGRYHGYLFAQTVPPSAVAIHVDVVES